MPSFGEWGFIVAGRRSFSHRIQADSLPVGLQFLTPTNVSTLFDFPLDMARVPAQINRLSNQALVTMFEQEWGKAAH